jgi:hypothetical protein
MGGVVSLSINLFSYELTNHDLVVLVQSVSHTHLHEAKPIKLRYIPLLRRRLFSCTDRIISSEGGRTIPAVKP